MKCLLDNISNLQKQDNDKNILISKLEKKGETYPLQVTKSDGYKM